MGSRLFPGHSSAHPPSQAEPLATAPASGGHWEVHACILNASLLEKAQAASTPKLLFVIRGE